MKKWWILNRWKLCHKIWLPNINHVLSAKRKSLYLIQINVFHVYYVWKCCFIWVKKTMKVDHSIIINGNCFSFELSCSELLKNFSLPLIQITIINNKQSFFLSTFLLNKQSINILMILLYRHLFLITWRFFINNKLVTRWLKINFNHHLIISHCSYCLQELFKSFLIENFEPLIDPFKSVTEIFKLEFSELYFLEKSITACWEKNSI